MCKLFLHTSFFLCLYEFFRLDTAWLSNSSSLRSMLTLETSIAGSFGKKSISQILLKHTAKVLIFPLLFVSLQPTLQYFKRIMAHNCENCKFRAHYDKEPNSFLGKFWRWHINFCPGWKGYFTSQSEDKKAELRAKYNFTKY